MSFQLFPLSSICRSEEPLAPQKYLNEGPHPILVQKMSQGTLHGGAVDSLGCALYQSAHHARSI